MTSFPLVIAIMLATEPAQQSKVAPVEIESSSVSDQPDSSEVTFYVRNNSSKPVVAWQVAIKATFSDGRVESGALGVDGYAAYAGLIPIGAEESVIMPKSVVKGTLQFPRRSGVSLIVVRPSVIAAVFDDRTATGDAVTIAEIFSRRERDCAAYLFIVNALRAGHAQAPGRDGLVAALEKVNSRTQEDFDNAEKQFIRRELQKALNADRDARGQVGMHPDDVLRRLILSMEGRWQAANSNRRPKS